MKQISTGTGLCVLGLGIAVLGAAQLIGSKGTQAFAQSTGDRHIVSASVNTVQESVPSWGMASAHYEYRIWSDNSVEIKCLGRSTSNGNSFYNATFYPIYDGNFVGWRTVDNGLTSFVPADVDANGSVDSADLGNVLVNYGETQDGNPPPPIDCTINAPR